MGAPAAPPPYTLFTKTERRIMVVLIALAGWFSTLSSFIYYPAISRIADDLDTSVTLINLTVTSYMIVSGVAPAIVGDASDMFGRRPLYLTALTLYVLANVGIALQDSFAALLVLRMLQSAAISGTFSVAYGVIADFAAPSERGAFVGAVSLGITTAPSLGPVIGGSLAAQVGWRWIFWFLAIMAGCCLLAIVLLLPETNRALVGNGGLEPSRFSRPVIPGIMRPWADNRGPSAPVASRKNRVPNPIESLRVLSRKDVAVTIIPGSILYMIYSCIHTSLATTFIDSYGFSQLQAGLIYLPFGVGAIISTAVSGKWIDRDYRVVAKAHGLPINKVSGDDLLHFPIEEARMRSVFIPTFSALLSVLAYGWLVNEHVHIAGPLTCLFIAGFSIQTCFNVNNTLVIDINQEAPATAQASFNMVRCLLSAVFISVIQEMIDAIGFGPTFTILSSLCLVSAGFYFAELRYGRKWRLARHNITTETPSLSPIPLGIPSGTSRQAFSCRQSP
ncbi:major facilitator superfamily transporter [Coniochaeta sp. PMI_546]|nr:major facilitator superfamily transporter [Coniochaeta sp. PMI_546]